MRRFIDNPITTFIRRFCSGLFLELKYRKKHLRIGQMSYVRNVKFGSYNSLYTNSVVVDSELGDHTYIANNTNIYRTKIGKFCSIGSNVKCGVGSHPSRNFVSTHPIFYSTLEQSGLSFTDKDYFKELGEIEIGNDVWICDNAVVIDGAKIGDGAIIAAGAIVSGEIPAYVIAGGVPAKLIRYRFEKKEIEKLLKIKWWNKDSAWLRKNYKKFHDIKNFLH